MCIANITNVPQKHRNFIEFPTGHTGSLNDLERLHVSVPAPERERLTSLVLSAIPDRERRKIRAWAASKTKAIPTPQGFVELLVFYVIAFAAERLKILLKDVVELVTQKKTAADILVRA